MSRGNDLVAVLRALMKSRDHWRSLVAHKADELVAVAFEALLERAPDADALKFYAAQLKEGKGLQCLLAAVAQSQEHWRKQVAHQADELVRMVYMGLLNREPDPEALNTYGSRLRDTGDLIGLIRSVAQSREHWENVLDTHAEEWARSEGHWESLLELKAGELARAACEGLLGGAAEERTLEEYAAQLREHRDLPRLLSALGRSQEHWEQLLALRAEELVGTVYESLLKRRPDAPALRDYGGQLKQSKDLGALLSTVIG